MKYTNPIIKGFYSDPSCCRVGDTYYMIASTMQYSPGIPLFESHDLINWKQIGNVLTRPSQLRLEGSRSSGGVFAPTIRYNNGRFYVILENNSTCEQFYVYTDNIHGEWSEPIFVDQDGIDPSLLFDGDKVYFTSNGTADDGEGGIVQFEIDIETGRKIGKSVCVWKGSGGRYLEGPHLYHIGDWYYILAAEGGTEYGHMITVARSREPFGPFESCPANPILTNRNLGGYMIQGIGHGDLVCDTQGNWWMPHLGFRQIDRWQPYHHLGREIYLVPCEFTEDGWLKAGVDGITPLEVETDRIADSVVQQELGEYTLANAQYDLDWLRLRIPQEENYRLGADTVELRGTEYTLDDVASPTFIGLRMRDFDAEITADVELASGEAGLTLYMDEWQHFDLFVKNDGTTQRAALRLRIGDACAIAKEFELPQGAVTLKIYTDAIMFRFCAVTSDGEIELGSAHTKYLSTEVAGGFTGAIAAMYAVGTGEEFARFTRFSYLYK